MCFVSHFCRRPVLHGDNWWRGHAAAFLKYVKLPPEVLRRGRVNQVILFYCSYLSLSHFLKIIQTLAVIGLIAEFFGLTSFIVDNK